MSTNSRAPIDRVVERQRAVLLARHYREAESLTIKQIADRFGRSPATVKAYFYDPSRVTKDQVLMTDRVSERRRAAQLHATTATRRAWRSPRSLAGWGAQRAP